MVNIASTGLMITAGHFPTLYINFQPVAQVTEQHVPSYILHCHIRCNMYNGYNNLMSKNYLICPSYYIFVRNFVVVFVNFLP